MKKRIPVFHRMIILVGFAFFFIGQTKAQEYEPIGIGSYKSDTSAYYKVYVGSIIVLDSVESPFSSYVRPYRHVGKDSLLLSVPIRSTVSVPVRLQLHATIVDQDGLVHFTIDQFMWLQGQTTKSFEMKFIEPRLFNEEHRLQYKVSLVHPIGVLIENEFGSFPFRISLDTYSHENSIQADSHSSILYQIDSYYWLSFYQMAESIYGSDRQFIGIDVASVAADGKLDDEHYTIYLLEWVDRNDNIPQLEEILMYENISPLDHPYMEIRAFAAVAFDNKVIDQHEIQTLSIWEQHWFDQSGAALVKFEVKPGATYVLCTEFRGTNVGLSLAQRPQNARIADILFNPFGDGEYHEGFSDSVPVMRFRVDLADD